MEEEINQSELGHLLDKRIESLREDIKKEAKQEAKREVREEIEELESQIKDLKQPSTTDKRLSDPVNQISRREFLKKAGLGTFGLAAMGLTHSSALNVRSDDFGVYTQDAESAPYFSVDGNGPVNIQNTYLDLNDGGIRNVGGLELPQTSPNEAEDNHIWIDSDELELRIKLQGDLYRANLTKLNGVSYYKFEQNLEDAWGSNNGTNSGALYSSESRYGSYSIESYGSDSEAVLGDYLNTNSFSLSVWVYVHNVTIKPRIISDEKLNMTISGDYDGNNLAFTLSGSSSGNRITAFTPNTNQWYHVVMTWNGTTQALYVDGSLQSTATPSITPLNDTTPLKLFGNAGQSVYDGLLDELKCYDRALSSQQVTNLYNQRSIHG